MKHRKTQRGKKLPGNLTTTIGIASKQFFPSKSSAQKGADHRRNIDECSKPSSGLHEPGVLGSICPRTSLPGALADDA